MNEKRLEMGWRFATVMIVLVMLCGVVMNRMDRARGIMPPAVEVAGDVAGESKARFVITGTRVVSEGRNILQGDLFIHAMEDTATGAQYVVVESLKGLAMARVHTNVNRGP